MALKFSDTELFNNPINLADVKLISEGKIAVFSHYRIESKVFEKLYNIGMSTFSN